MDYIKDFIKVKCKKCKTNINQNKEVPNNYECYCGNVSLNAGEKYSDYYDNGFFFQINHIENDNYFIESKISSCYEKEKNLFSMINKIIDNGVFF